MQRFDDLDGCLDLALNLVDGPGLALEFGVASGRTLRCIVGAMPHGSRVIGFDSFDGLPEHWRDGFPAGMFRTTPPDVPGAELVVGLYADTLPTWKPRKGETVKLLHVDCDLYSSTRDVLAGVGPHLKPGALVVFDEFHGYPGHRQHEAKAWGEWVEANGVEATQLAAGPEQALFRIEVI